MTTADDAFIRYKSRQVVAWTLRNTRLLHTAPSAMCMRQPLANRTVFVVGAGYSLTTNLDRIPRDATVIAVNAADQILRSVGITPAVLVIRESLDHADTIAASDAPLICADVGVHPRTWDAAGDRLAWFYPGYPHTLGTCHRIAVRPLFGGSAATTSAVALAMHWGATRIVLVGVDLALTKVDGAYLNYHPAAPRGDLVATLEESADGLYLIQSGNVADDERAERSGQKPQPKRIRAELAAPYDWGPPVPTIDTLVDQRRWLETQAQRHGHRIEMLNASRGAGISGWRCVDLADVHYEAQPAPIFGRPFPINKAINEALVHDMDRGAEQQAELCDAMLGKPSLATFERHATSWAPLPEALAAWRIIDGPEGDPLKRLRHTYESLRASAYEAREILNTGRAT